MANPLQESSNVSATSDVAEIPEAEAYANVGASMHYSLDIGQATPTTPGISVGHASAPVASGVPPGPHETDIIPAGIRTAVFFGGFKVAIATTNANYYILCYM